MVRIESQPNPRSKTGGSPRVKRVYLKPDRSFPAATFRTQLEMRGFGLRVISGSSPALVYSFSGPGTGGDVDPTKELAGPLSWTGIGDGEVVAQSFGRLDVFWPAGSANGLRQLVLDVILEPIERAPLVAAPAGGLVVGLGEGQGVSVPTGPAGHNAYVDETEEAQPTYRYRGGPYRFAFTPGRSPFVRLNGWARWATGSGSIRVQTSARLPANFNEIIRVSTSAVGGIEVAILDVACPPGLLAITLASDAGAHSVNYAFQATG